MSSDLVMEISKIIVGPAAMLVLLGLLAAVVMPGIDRWSKRFFISYFLVLALYIGFIIAELLYYSLVGDRSVPDSVYYFETFFASLLPPMMTAFLLHCCGEDWRKSRIFRAAAALWFIFFIMLSISPFTDLFYYISPELEFSRGPLYSLIVVPVWLILLINLTGMICFRNRLSRRYFYSFLIGFLPMTAALFIQIFYSVFILLGFGVAITAFLMVGIILSDQVEKYMKQEREIAHQRASIMVLLMRPHFIYNTMMSIYYLCKQDPDLAQQVTLDFTAYLRKNFTAISSEEPIPFFDELEHTRAYLAVEQAQFEDGLFVDYDTPHTDFRLPPLTLQPIVENAVKHGMDPDSEPLHIFIRTKKTDSRSEILVENDGADFGAADDGGPHIALKNIQQRLELMCRGTMEIMPREGGGTIVRVSIPSAE